MRYALNATFALFFSAIITNCTLGDDNSTSENHWANAPELRRGIGGEPQTLDPGKAGDEFSYEILRDLYEGLTTEGPDGSVLPGVAESWEVNPSGNRYVFKIRSSALWSNGQHITANQFVAAWRRAVTPSNASATSDSLRLIAGADEIIKGMSKPETLGVYAPKDDELIVNLVQPAPFFPQILSSPATFPIFSVSAASTHNPKLWVSNGAYVLHEWVLGSGLHLTKNPNYWERGKVRISRVAYIPVADDNAELRQYEAGQLDITHSVPNGDLPDLLSSRPSELHIAPFLGTAYYALNLHSSSSLNEKNLRQALAMAVDRKELQRSVLSFGQNAAYGFVPPGTLNYEAQEWPWHTLTDEIRKSEARRLYKSSSALKPLHLKLLFNSSPNIKKMAIAIASMWKDILGIDCELVDEEYRVFLDSRKSGSKWDVIRLGWTADFNDATSFLDTFRQSSPNNDSGFSSAQYDDFLNQASRENDKSLRQELLQKAEALMLSEYPIIPIYFYSSKRLVRSEVKGIIANPLNRLLSKHLYLDWGKT